MNASRVFAPRSTYSTGAPSTSTTQAPALRAGRCFTVPSCAKEGIAGQLSAAPYGFAGSVAANRVTVNVPYTCSVSVRCGV